MFAPETNVSEMNLLVTDLKRKILILVGILFTMYRAHSAMLKMEADEAVGLIINDRKACLNKY